MQSRNFIPSAGLYTETHSLFHTVCNLLRPNLLRHNFGEGVLDEFAAGGGAAVVDADFAHSTAYLANSNSEPKMDFPCCTDLTSPVARVFLGTYCVHYATKENLNGGRSELR